MQTQTPVVHPALPEEVALVPTFPQPQTPAPDDQSLPIFMAAAGMATPPPLNKRQQPQTQAPTITTFPVTLAEIATQSQQDPVPVASAQSPISSATVPSSTPLLLSLMPTVPSQNASQISFKSLRSLLAPAQLKLSDILGPLGIDLGALNSLPLATTANQQQQQLQHSLDDRAHQQADQQAHQQADQQHERDNAAFLAMLAVRQAQAQQGGGAAPNLKLSGLVARAPAPASAAVVTVDTGVKIADLFPGKGSG